MNFEETCLYKYLQTRDAWVRQISTTDGQNLRSSKLLQEKQPEHSGIKRCCKD